MVEKISIFLRFVNIQQVRRQLKGRYTHLIAKTIEKIQQTAAVILIKRIP